MKIGGLIRYLGEGKNSGDWSELENAFFQVLKHGVLVVFVEKTQTEMIE